MSFETDLKKLQKLWDNSQNNEFTIESVSLLQDNKYQQINELPYRINKFNTLTNLSVDWQNITIPTPFAGINNYLSIQWQIVATLPRDWVPFARFQLGYRASDSFPQAPFTNDPLVTASDSIIYTYTTQINTTDTDLVQVTWNIAFSIQNATHPLLLTPFQVKLYFLLLNPNFCV